MKFKELDTKGKIEHIWEYYRLRIFMIIFLVCVGISIIYTIFIKPHPNLYCGIAMYDQFMSISDIEAMTNELNTKFNLNNKEYTVEIQSFYTDQNDVMVEAELNQKFNTYIYASQFNILLGNKENTNTFISSEYVAPLSDYLTNDEIKAYDEKGLVLYALDPYSNQTKPMAIKLENSAILNKYNIYQDKDCYLSFVPMPAEYKENTIKAFNEYIKQ